MLNQKFRSCTKHMHLLVIWSSFLIWCLSLWGFCGKDSSSREIFVNAYKGCILLLHVFWCVTDVGISLVCPLWMAIQDNNLWNMGLTLCSTFSNWGSCTKHCNRGMLICKSISSNHLTFYMMYTQLQLFVYAGKWFYFW